MLLALAVSLLPSALPAPQATPIYPCTSYPSGDALASAVCDFDRDGHLDVVVAHYSGVELLRGDGAGPLDTRRPIVGMPDGVVSELAVADFNGDGWLDLAALIGQLHEPRRLTIAVSNQAGDVTPLWRSPRSSFAGLVSGDCDGDGRAEFVLRGTGPKPTLVVRFNAGSVAVLRLAMDTPWLLTDVDGDGADEAFTTAPGASTSRMYSGFGPLGWSNSASVPFGRPLNQSVADLDLDGDRELVIFRWVFPNSLLTLVDYAGNGQFVLRDLSIGEFDPSFPPVNGDYDGDGTVDLLVNHLGRQQVLLDIAGPGPQQFMPYHGSPNTIYWGPGSPNPAPDTTAAGRVDLNEDGADDVVFVSGIFGVIVTLSDGQGALALDAPAKDNSWVMVAGDVNNDSHLDLIVHDLTEIHVVLGDGQGGLTPQCSMTFTTASPNPYGSRLFDWDGDGDLDLFADLGGNSLYVNDGTGCFGGAPTAFPAPLFRTAFGRYDGDAFLDVVDYDGNLYRGDGFGGLHPPVPTNLQFNPMHWRVVAGVGDLDGDGLDDLATADWTNGFVLHRATGSGTFAQLISLSPFPEALTGGDFDGDGHRDVAWVSDAATGDRLTHVFGDGAGGFTSPTTLEIDAYPYHDNLAAADFDGDGRDDLINQRVTISLFRTDLYRALPNGGFVRLPGSISNGFQPDPVVGDFNSDGLPDFAVNVTLPPNRYHTRLLLSR